MIRYITSYNMTDCTNQQLTTWATHEENETACASGDNAKKTHNDISWFIQTTTDKLRHNSQTSEMI